MTNDEFIEVVKELEVFFGSRRIIHDQTPEEYISKILLEDGNILTLSKLHGDKGSEVVAEVVCLGG